jgi:hypothetical protein
MYRSYATLNPELGLTRRRVAALTKNLGFMNFNA